MHEKLQSSLNSVHITDIHFTLIDLCYQNLIKIIYNIIVHKNLIEMVYIYIYNSQLCNLLRYYCKPFCAASCFIINFIKSLTRRGKTVVGIKRHSLFALSASIKILTKRGGDAHALRLGSITSSDLVTFRPGAV